MISLVVRAGAIEYEQNQDDIATAEFRELKAILIIMKQLLNI